MAAEAIRIYDPQTYPRCNWSVAPSGAAREVAQIERLLGELRARHPIVSHG